MTTTPEDVESRQALLDAIKTSMRNAESALSRARGMLDSAEDRALPMVRYRMAEAVEKLASALGELVIAQC